MKDLSEVITGLEQEYDQESGFLGALRLGQFDQGAYERLLRRLDDIHPEGDTVDRRLVALLWYMPQLIEWQEDRAAELGTDREAVLDARDHVRTQIERILGVP